MKSGTKESNQQGILFFSGGWSVGGIEKVSVVLANEFVRRGYSVVIAFFVLQDRALFAQLDRRVVVKCLPRGYSRGGVNRNMLRALVKDNHVKYVLDAFHCPIFLRWACRGLKVKVVRYHHNKPDTNGRIESAQNPISRSLWRFMTRWMVRIDYWLDDAYVILAESFKKPFMHFTGIKNPQKLFAINNPLTIEHNENTQKENVILYCGRLDEHQKRVSRILDIWDLIMVNLPDWRLEIVGDGPDRSRYEEQASSLYNVSFVGFQNPGSYYATAKILLMTSDFEGWPLVLVEAMSYGCVPVALGSYEAIWDVINDGMNGIVVPTPFNIQYFTSSILSLVNDHHRLSQMSENAVASSRRFSVEATGDKWESVFHQLK